MIPLGAIGNLPSFRLGKPLPFLAKSLSHSGDGFHQSQGIQSLTHSVENPPQPGTWHRGCTIVRAAPALIGRCRNWKLSQTQGQRAAGPGDGGPPRKRGGPFPSHPRSGRIPVERGVIAAPVVQIGAPTTG